MNQDDAPKASRRGVLIAGAAILAAGAAVRPAAADEPTQKIEKSLVGYVDKSTNPQGQHCSICANFQPPNACAIVAGTINPNGWCGAFAPKG